MVTPWNVVRWHKSYWFGECKRPLTNYFDLAKADMLKTCTFVVTFYASNYDLSLPVPGSEIVGYPKLRKRNVKIKRELISSLALHLRVISTFSEPGTWLTLFLQVMKSVIGQFSKASKGDISDKDVTRAKWVPRLSYSMWYLQGRIVAAPTLFPMYPAPHFGGNFFCRKAQKLEPPKM